MFSVAKYCLRPWECVFNVLACNVIKKDSKKIVFRCILKNFSKLKVNKNAKSTKMLKVNKK